MTGDVFPGWLAITIAFLSPLLLAYAARFLDLAEKLRAIVIHFIAGAALAFVALLAEGFAHSIFATSIPADYGIIVRAFVFVALVEEVLKIAQIAQLAESHRADTLKEMASIAIAVAAGFAGAENVIYLFRYSSDVVNLLGIRVLTAVPLHLATAVITAHFLIKTRKGDDNLHFLAIAVIVATSIHGLYDYLIIESRGHSFSYLFVLGFAISWAWRIVSAAKADKVK